jgi:hypothetical protein
MKNSNDKIGNRTRDLPTYSAVPEPTALPRTPFQYVEQMLNEMQRQISESAPMQYSTSSKNTLPRKGFCMQHVEYLCVYWCIRIWYKLTQ